MRGQGYWPLPFVLLLIFTGALLTLGPEFVYLRDFFGTRLNTEFIKGMGNLDDQFVIILDIDRVFTVDELSLLADHHELGENGEAAVA